MSLTALRKCQIGKESTRGTAVAATKILLLNSISAREEQDYVQPQYEVGRISQLSQSHLAGKLAKLSAQGVMNYEQILDFLLMGIKGGVTGVQQGATAAYLWTFSPNLAASGDFDSYTFEFGNDQQAYEAEYCLASEIRISGSQRQPLNISVELFGRQITAVSFTGALTEPTVEPVLMSKGKLYIDDTWAGLGGSQKTATLYNVDIRIPTMITPLFTSDGNLYFQTFAENRRSIEVDMTLLFNATGDAEREYAASRTDRFVRLLWEGSNIEDSYDHKFQLDFCGRYSQDLLPLDSVDGQDVVHAKLQSFYDDTGAKEFEFAVQNAIDAV